MKPSIFRLAGLLGSTPPSMDISVGTGSTMPHTAMDALRTFPHDGWMDETGAFPKERRVAYRCGNESDYGCDPYTFAYTEVNRTGTGLNTSYVFCPLFFNQSSIHDVALTYGPRTPADLEAYMSFERVLIHELMHSDNVFKPSVERHMVFFGHISDRFDYLPGYPTSFGGIYGAQLSHAFAWYYAPVNNVKTTLNADNYAWYFSNNWLANQWGWNDTGTEDILSAGFEQDGEGNRAPYKYGEVLFE